MTDYPPGTTVYNCPLPSCEWRYTLPEGDEWRNIEAPEPDALSNAALGEFAATIGRQRMLAVERILEAHLKTHTLVEWMTEIDRLNWLLAKAGAPTGAMIEVDRSDLAELLAKVPHEGTAWERLADRMLSTSRR